MNADIELKKLNLYKITVNDRSNSFYIASQNADNALRILLNNQIETNWLMDNYTKAKFEIELIAGLEKNDYYDMFHIQGE